MSTAPSRDVAHDGPPNGGSAGEYKRLRELLVGPEQSRLDELQRRLEDRQLRTEDLSQVVAEAITLRARRDRALQQTLNPLVEEAVRISVTRDPGILAQALFPVIGEAVRKAVAHALRSLVESVNQTVERSISIDAIKWRIESLRTGRPFGEIVLMRSVRYRVEQVFLIHRETGLLLQHVARTEQIVQDSELVSGMLTAIQDFVHDSFKGAGDQEIETIELGEFNLWVQHGPSAILAAVVSGTPPPELRHMLERTLEDIHTQYGPAMAEFTGDASPFSGTRPRLAACLLGRQAQRAATRSKFLVVLLAAAVLVAAGAIIFYLVRNERRWDMLVQRLRQEPGIMLTSAERSGGRYRLVGLRDPLSTDPEKLIQASGIDPEKITARWEPYASLDVKFKFFRQFLAEKVALEQEVLRFPVNSSRITAEQLPKLDDIESHIALLQQGEAGVGQKIVIELRGHTDPSGNEEKNDSLSQERAENVAKALISRGIAGNVLRVVAMGSREPVRRTAGSYLTELNRRVTFVVTTESEAKR